MKSLLDEIYALISSSLILYTKKSIELFLSYDIALEFYKKRNDRQTFKETLWGFLCTFLLIGKGHLIYNKVNVRISNTL